MSEKMLDLALSQYGIAEVNGIENNDTILGYFRDIGFSQLQDDGKYAWCSAFINWLALKCDKESSKKLNARSWLDIGDKVENPSKGDIVIFWRESRDSWKGHVGLFINEVDEWIFTLGGNQNNMVCIKAYPKSRLLGYRKLGDSI